MMERNETTVRLGQTAVLKARLVLARPKLALSILHQRLCSIIKDSEI